MRRKKGKFKKVQKKKILLIVENSEVDFFNRYFKNFLQKEYDILIKCESSGSAGKCDITNGSKMTRKINDALNTDDIQAVFLLIDLETKCFQSEQKHTCIIELKREYQSKYKVEKNLEDKFYFLVVEKEIESWFLTVNESKPHTNNISENHIKEIKAFLKVDSKQEIVDRMLEGLDSGKYKLDFSKNSSLQHFIKKLQEYR